MISDSETVGRLTYVALTEIGADHNRLGIPNQDAVIIELLGEDFVAAVSDGVGSCKKSDLGAQKVVSICRELFFEIHNGKIVFDGHAIVKGLIDAWKKSFDSDLSEYCATAKVVMKIGKKAVLVSIGDGFAAITSEGMKVISPNEDHAFTNETKCLDAKVSVGDFWIKNFDIDTNTLFTVLVCTDGVANAIHAGDELAFVEEIEQNIKSENLEAELKDFMIDISQYSFDDKTLGAVKYER